MAWFPYNPGLEAFRILRVDRSPHTVPSSIKKAMLDAAKSGQLAEAPFFGRVGGEPKDDWWVHCRSLGLGVYAIFSILFAIELLHPWLFGRLPSQNLPWKIVFSNIVSPLVENTWYSSDILNSQLVNLPSLQVLDGMDTTGSSRTQAEADVEPVAAVPVKAVPVKAVPTEVWCWGLVEYHINGWILGWCWNVKDKMQPRMLSS